MPRFIRSFLLLVLIGFLCVSCAGFYGYNRSERSSSIVEYLYPDQSKPLPEVDPERETGGTGWLVMDRTGKVNTWDGV